MRGWQIAVAILVINGSVVAQGNSSMDSTMLNQGDYGKGQFFQRRLKFDSALVYFQRFHERWSGSADLEGKAKLKEVQKRIVECESGIKLVAAPKKFIIRNMGPEINSMYEDYAPITNSDENLIVFTSRRPLTKTSLEKDIDGKYFEDIYFSKKENEQWMPAENIGPPVNTPYHDSDLALSADGRQLYLYTDKNEGDILVSRWNNGKWSTPERLPWPINTPYHESSVSVTADGKKLFVASERPGGLGGSDIYVFEKRQTGQWSAAVNLGPAINTEWDEDSPFIDYDGVTLYFSSTGHNSMGGHDIFRSTDSLKKWTRAENLGYPINTPGHDSYFASTRDGKGAYYSSVRPEGMGKEDIYHITLPEELAREDVATIPSMKKPSISRVDEAGLILHFRYGSDKLEEQEQQRLRDFTEGIQKQKAYVIQIAGHTDDIGEEASNKELSEARAQSVKLFFESRGLPASQMILSGWGASRPLADNLDELNGRARNRRVEVRVIYN